MTFILIITVVLGVFVGYGLFPSTWFNATDYIMDGGLCLLLLLVGIDIGKQKNVLLEIKKMGLSIVFVPIMIAAGSIFGALIGGAIIGLPIHEAGAVGAGFGWYSLSAVILSDYSAQLSALAFLTNVIRELLAIVSIPFVAKWAGYMEAVAPAGATAMDTTLPIITKYTDSKIAVMAFVSGAILSSLVPLLVPLIIGL
ncbi:MAG: hypothetical protein CVV02_17760 [Firmicutes bacterium HGW-Firmicutes-7]|nr:MAG: hypothetical protein CVV02_17760 [Firmicutes bacterium HGW-Firmicutes-7]